MKGLECPRLLLAVLGVQHLVEQPGAQGWVGTADAADIVELPALVVGLQPFALGSQHRVVSVATDRGQAVGHVHVVLFTEEGVVVLLPNGVDLVEQFGRGGIGAQLADDILPALLRAVLAQEVHHAEFECFALFWCEVEGNLEHVVDGRRHNERVALLHHEAVEFAEV